MSSGDKKRVDRAQEEAPVAKPLAFKDAAAATTAGTGAADASDRMMTDAASAPCAAEHSAWVQLEQRCQLGRGEAVSPQIVSG